MVQHHILQRAISEAINRPDFTASLPPLSDKTWTRILAYTAHAHAENDRLEFLGDALMYATLAPQLYAQYPNGTPHLYTCVRAVLHSNATFSLLAEKLDIMAVSSTVLQALTNRTFGEGALAPHKSRPQVKATADLFETVIGAYYLDYGFEALYKWVEGIYAPLIRAVAETFFDFQNGPHGTLRGPGEKKRNMEPFMYRRGLLTTGPIAGPPPSPLKKSKQMRRADVAAAKQKARMTEKIKGANARSPRTTNLKARILGYPSPTLKVASRRERLKPAMNAAYVSQVASLAVPMKSTPIFIDLTVDSDSEDCESEHSQRRPLVTPRIPRRSPPLPKRKKLLAPASAHATALTSVFPTLVVTESGGYSSSSESEDEVMLEKMLTADDPSSCSDMDRGSSDVESSAGPSHLPRSLSGSGLGNGALDVPQPWQVRRSVFL